MPILPLLVLLAAPVQCPDAKSCEAACNKKVAASCRHLAELLFLGEGIARDDARGAELARKACDLKDMAACVLLAHVTEESDPKLAFTLYERACTGKVYEACAEAGVFLASGEGGVTKDEKKAKALWEGGCKGRREGQLHQPRQDVPPGSRRAEGRAAGHRLLREGVRARRRGQLR